MADSASAVLTSAPDRRRINIAVVTDRDTWAQLDHMRAMTSCTWDQLLRAALAGGDAA